MFAIRISKFRQKLKMRVYRNSWCCAGFRLTMASGVSKDVESPSWSLLTYISRLLESGIRDIRGSPCSNSDMDEDISTVENRSQFRPRPFCVDMPASRWWAYSYLGMQIPDINSFLGTWYFMYVTDWLVDYHKADTYWSLLLVINVADMVTFDAVRSPSDMWTQLKILSS